MGRVARPREGLKERKKGRKCGFVRRERERRKASREEREVGETGEQTQLGCACGSSVSVLQKYGKACESVIHMDDPIPRVPPHPHSRESALM
eukprot:237969-Chlamydomonas_euryale.AAC.2